MIWWTIWPMVHRTALCFSLGHKTRYGNTSHVSGINHGSVRIIIANLLRLDVHISAAVPHVVNWWSRVSVCAHLVHSSDACRWILWSLLCVGIISCMTRYHVHLISSFRKGLLTFGHTRAQSGDGKRIVILIGRGWRTSGDIAHMVLYIRLLSAGFVSLSSGDLM
jgi:hypothetical protein